MSDKEGMKIRIILFSLLFISSCSYLDKAAYEASENQVRSENTVDTNAYWEFQYVTLAQFYEVECKVAEDSFSSYASNMGYEKAKKEIPGICSPVKGLKDHSGKCMPEQGDSTYKIKNIKGQTVRVDFIKAGKRCFADVHLLVKVTKDRGGRSICHKGPSTECSLYLKKLESKNISLVREIGRDADIYFRRTGFRGRLFNFYHFETTQNNFEKSDSYRSYSSSPY
ncbi:MAG: hypothetical protein ACJAT2_003078 [Bacteriovoracaceae bacterium]